MILVMLGYVKKKELPAAARAPRKRDRSAPIPAAPRTRAQAARRGLAAAREAGLRCRIGLDK